MNYFNCDYLQSDLRISIPGKCLEIIKTKKYLKLKKTFPPSARLSVRSAVICSI